MFAAVTLLLTGASERAFAQEDDDDEDAIVVEGEPIERADPRQAGASVTVVPLDERLPPGSDAGDAVSRAPGTTVRRLGGLGSYSAVSIRGSAMRQVQIHLDGLPLNPDGSSAVNLSALPFEALRRVEVWRGAAPAELAASPIGGVVDLRTRDEPVPLPLTAEASSWSSLRAGVRGGARLGGTDLLGGASGFTTRADFLAFDDHNTPFNRIDDRLRRRTSNQRSQASGLLRLSGGEGSWSALLAGTFRDESLPGPIGGTPQGALTTGWLLAGAQSRVAPGTTLRAWSQLRHETRTPLDAVPNRQVQAQAGTMASTLGSVRPDLVLGATGQVRLDVQRTLGASDAPTRLTATAVAHARWSPTDTLLIEPVVHTQAWLDRGFGEDRLRLAVNPRATARLDLGDHVVGHAAGGYAIRPPDFLELFGDRGAVQGRADLLPERSLWADAGVRVLGEVSTLEVAAFAQDTTDRIVFVQNSDRTLVPINSDPSLAAGVELGVETTAWDRVDARLAATWTETWVHAGPYTGKRLPRIPRLAGILDLGLRPTDTIRLGLDLDLVTGNTWDQANLFWAPTRALAGASVRYTPGGPLPAITLAVRNLTDTLAQAGPANPLDPDGPRAMRPITDFAGYPLPGRTLLLGLTWTPAAKPPEAPR